MHVCMVGLNEFLVSCANRRDDEDRGVGEGRKGEDRWGGGVGEGRKGEDRWGGGVGEGRKEEWVRGGRGSG